MAQYGLPEYDADILTTERSLSDYFEAAFSATAATPSASRTG
jgi:aspartyl-tRNA(Asn)/glutamyl-tRNA(Gln) amidotransferase subunit B